MKDQKRYYSRPEVAKELKIYPSSIDYWSKEFGIKPVRKGYYTADQLEQFKLIARIRKDSHEYIKEILSIS